MEVNMARKNFDDKSKKYELGRLIAKCRGDMSQRQLAKAIGIPPSNMTYIENGINVPTSDTYEKIISVLAPNMKEHKKMDFLYSSIRHAPPPDVCNVVLEHVGLGETLRLLAGKKLSEENLREIEALFSSF